MISKRLLAILEQSDLTVSDLDRMLGGKIDLNLILSGQSFPSSKEIPTIASVLKVSTSLISYPEIEVPVMKKSMGVLSSASKTRILQFIFNFRKLYLDLGMESISFEKTPVKEEVDIHSLVREITRSRLSLREYLETRGIYVIELDRCKGFEGAIYSCGDVLFIMLNKYHRYKRKFQTLVELSAECLLQFDNKMSFEQTDNLCSIFCEEILKNLPCEQTFSILAKLVAMAVSREIIIAERDKEYMIVPSR